MFRTIAFPVSIVCGQASMRIRIWCHVVDLHTREKFFTCVCICLCVCAFVWLRSANADQCQRNLLVVFNQPVRHSQAPS